MKDRLPPIKDSYPWEMDKRLFAQVCTRDTKAAVREINRLLEFVKEQECLQQFEVLRLMVLQALTIASFAAYDSGAQPAQLHQLNVNMITELICVNGWDGVFSLARKFIVNMTLLIPPADMIDDKKLTKALDYIGKHCIENITRREVAGELGCSLASLDRLFAGKLGRGFKETVLRYRIDIAKRLLLDNSKSVIDVAYDVGYSDTNYFITVFRKVTGITPGQFRRKAAFGDTGSNGEEGM